MDTGHGASMGIKTVSGGVCISHFSFCGRCIAHVRLGVRPAIIPGRHVVLPPVFP